MVQQTPQSRLLNNLLKSTKDYTSTLTSHILVSHTSLSGLQAYASASSPSTSAAIFGAAEALQRADDALVRYGEEVDIWRERLKEVRAAEEDVANILRDREILVTRLIKASSKKPTRDSVIHGSSSPSVSVVSLGAAGQSPQHRMTSAQAELQACEKQLSEKQRQLEQIRSIAIRDGLEQRLNALVRLGTTLSEAGNEGVRALQEGYAAIPNGIPHDVSEMFRSLPPRPSSANGMSDNSLAPSQSASQLGNFTAAEASHSRSYSTPGPSSLPQERGSPLRPTQEESDDSDSEHGPLNVVENTRPAPPNGAARASVQRRYSSDVGPSTPRTLARPANIRAPSNTSNAEPRKHKGFFGAFTGFFRSDAKSSAKGTNSDRDTSSPVKTTNSAWHTRTDRNIALARGDARDGSSDDEVDTARYVAVENKPGATLTLPSATPAKRKSISDGTQLSGPAPRKLQRSSSTSKVPSTNKSAKKPRKTGSDVGGSTAPARPTEPVPPLPQSLMRSASGRSRNGSGSTTPKASRARTASLNAAPSTPPPARNPARGKPLKLTAATTDPTAWIHSPESSSNAHHRSTSVKSAPGASPARQHHQRSGSLDVKAPNLMTLVEDVVADRQRSGVMSAVHNSPGPRMMLPSEYIKAIGPSHTTPAVQPTTPNGHHHYHHHHSSVPTVAVNPPTPGKEHPPSPEKSRYNSSTSRDSLELKHTPPPRSASPLRSALKSNSLPPPPRPVPTLINVVAPVPIRPTPLSRNSMTMESDDASAYETGHEDISDDDDDKEVATPTRETGPGFGEPSTPRTAVPMSNGVAPSHEKPASNVSTDVSTELGGAEGVQRRKSVRLNVPPTPDHEAGQFVLSQSQREKPLPQPNGGAGASSSNRTRPASQWSSRLADEASAPDMWANSSDDEGEEYKRARRALSKAIKKEKAEFAEATTIVAASGPGVKKRHSMKHR